MSATTLLILVLLYAAGFGAIMTCLVAVHRWQDCILQLPRGFPMKPAALETEHPKEPIA